MPAYLFWTFAALMLVFGAAVVLNRNPVASALSLVVSFLGLAALFMGLDAFFIGIIQVLVYAGAVMVLFVFVIMLLNVGRSASDIRGLPVRVVAVLVGAGLLAQLLLLGRVTAGGMALTQGVAAGAGSPMDAFPAGVAGAAAPAAQCVVGAIAEPLFRTYLKTTIAS